MIISRTPYRISLFGGGTDFPAWYNKHGGHCISFTIDKYSYITARHLAPFFPHTYRVSYSKIELAKKVEDIQHPAFREAIRLFTHDGVEAQHHGDLPARSGLGSSSAFAVGIIHALKKLSDIDIVKGDLANEAINFEQVVLQENVGCQDQIACSLGGLNSIRFQSGGNWHASKLNLSSQQLTNFESHMVLVYSGVQRISSHISQPLLKSFNEKQSVLLRIAELASECERVFESSKCDFLQIGDLLEESWYLKKESNPLAINSSLQEIYNFAKSKGALSGKVLGAGGGGFMLFWCRPENQLKLMNEFKKQKYLVVPFKVEFQGSTLI